MAIDPNMQYLGGSSSFNEALPNPGATPIGGSGDDWFAQFNPAQASPNTGIAGGGGMSTAGGVQGDAAFDAFGRGWTGSGGRTVTDLQNYVQQWNAQNPGAQVTLGGSKGDKVYGPGGEFWNDAVISAGTGGTGASWGPKGGGDASASGGVGNGQFLTPWTQQFAAPTAEQALNTPGLQFALDEANRLGQNSAAARGTLLNGRTQQALQASNIQNALQGYGDVYNRSLQEYGLARDNFYNNQDRPFSKLYSLSSLGENAAAQTGNFGSQYATGGASSLGSLGNANSGGSIAQGNIWGNYLNNIGQQRTT